MPKFQRSKDKVAEFKKMLMEGTICLEEDIMQIEINLTTLDAQNRMHTRMLRTHERGISPKTRLKFQKLLYEYILSAVGDIIEFEKERILSDNHEINHDIKMSAN